MSVNAPYDQTMAMREDVIGPVLRTLNELKREKLLVDYAGGGVACWKNGNDSMNADGLAREK